MPLFQSETVMVEKDRNGGDFLKINYTEGGIRLSISLGAKGKIKCQSRYGVSSRHGVTIIPDSALPEGARVEIAVSDEPGTELQAEFDLWELASSQALDLVERQMPQEHWNTARVNLVRPTPRCAGSRPVRRTTRPHHSERRLLSPSHGSSRPFHGNAGGAAHRRHTHRIAGRPKWLDRTVEDRVSDVRRRQTKPRFPLRCSGPDNARSDTFVARAIDRLSIRRPGNRPMLFQSETVIVEKDRDGSAFLKIDVPGQTHNMLSRRLLADLDAAFDAVAAAESPLPLLVIRSGKPSGFLAGADLHSFLEIADAAEAEAHPLKGNAYLTSWPRCPCRHWQESTAPVSAAVSNWPLPAIIVSSSTIPKRNSVCRK